MGIVIGTDGSRVYTVEGNSGDACKMCIRDRHCQELTLEDAIQTYEDSPQPEKRLGVTKNGIATVDLSLIHICYRYRQVRGHHRGAVLKAFQEAA